LGHRLRQPILGPSVAAPDLDTYWAACPDPGSGRCCCWIAVWRCARRFACTDPHDRGRADVDGISGAVLGIIVPLPADVSGTGRFVPAWPVGSATGIGAAWHNHCRLSRRPLRYGDGLLRLRRLPSPASFCC
jgi:hypothetical protein